MGRIEPLDPTDYTPEQEAIADRVAAAFGGVPGPYAAWIHTPRLMEKVFDVIDYLRTESPLPANLRLIATLVAVRHWGTAYAWGVNAQVAVRDGVDPAVVEAIGAARRPDFTDPREEAVYDICTELLETRGLSEATYAAAIERLRRDDFTEVVATAGYFSMVALTLLAFDIAPEPGAPALGDKPG